MIQLQKSTADSEGKVNLHMYRALAEGLEHDLAEGLPKDSSEDGSGSSDESHASDGENLESLATPDGADDRPQRRRKNVNYSVADFFDRNSSELVAPPTESPHQTGEASPALETGQSGSEADAESEAKSGGEADTLAEVDGLGELDVGEKGMEETQQRGRKRGPDIDLVDPGIIYPENDRRVDWAQLSSLIGLYHPNSSFTTVLHSQIEYEGPVAVITTRRSQQSIPRNWNNRRATSLALHKSVR